MLHRVLVLLVVLAAGLVPVAPVGATASPTGRLTQARALAGLSAVRQDATLAAPAALHATYLAATGVLSHEQDPSHPLATTAGAAAAGRSVLDATTTAVPDAAFVDRWLAAPFHALELLDPRLRRVGFASAPSASGRFAQVAVMDTRSGRDGAPTSPAPADPAAWVVWPGDGATSSRRAFSSGEWPDPLSACPGLTLPTGHPVLLRMPRAATVTQTSLVRDGAPVPHCVLTADTYDHPNAAAARRGRDLLDAANAVVLLPAAPLVDGLHRVRVDTTDGTASWSFRVGASDVAPTDPTVDLVPTATGRLAPAPGTASAAHGSAHPAVLAAELSRRLVDRDAATAAVLCRPDVHVDCLAAAVLAGPRVPVLYAGPTPAAPLPDITADELRRALPDGGRVWVVGGPEAVGPQVDARLSSLGLRPRRLAGEDRHATAVAIADRAAPEAGRVLLARSDVWVDAVAGGPLAAALGTPVLLTRPDGLPATTAAALSPGAAVTVLGGPDAVGDAVLHQVRARTGVAPTRLAGADRAATAAVIAEAWPDRGTSHLVAPFWDANGWVAALAASSWSAALRAPLLAGGPDGDLPAATRRTLAGTPRGSTALVLGADPAPLVSAAQEVLTAP